MMRLLRRLPKLWKLLRSADYRRGLRHGVPAAIEHEALMRRLKIRSLIDVGANSGQFSLVAAVCRPGLSIHAFEPLDEGADRFERLFGSNGDVVLHRLAAGEVNREAQIHVSGRSDSSSLLPISELQARSFHGTGEVALRYVPLRRLDDVLTSVDLDAPIMIKLDIQGYELAALKGMPELLQRAAYVYAEVSFLPLYVGQPLAAEIVTWLSERGFEMAGIQTIGRLPDGTCAQADILFSRVADAPSVASEASIL